MKVQKIDFLTRSISAPKNNKENSNTVTENRSYNPIAYKDYGISFGARLFRTPANFYAQPFNQKGMPETMKAYINDDYEDRKNMPPNQMLKLVFDDVNETKNLEQVKRVFPDEPLFTNLRDVPNKKARTGVLAEIDIMKEEGKPLFKNGDDHLGMYLLKKIYLEGKTLKEINKDFEKDISKEYNGISAIDYTTMNAYGIKFPNQAFWKSFTATREDFPYEYKPRKAFEHSKVSEKLEYTLSDIKNGTVEDKRPPKYKPNERDIKVLTDALTDKKPETALNQIKRKGGQNSENATFVSKYFSQIMSVALEKVDASGDMRDYFQNSENMSKSAKERMDKYWSNSTQMKQLRSMAMSDTIKLFFEVYGPDGNNDEFRDLLKYADSIKPEREKKLAEHNRIQQELEEALAVHETSDEPKAEAVVPKTTEEILKEEAKKFNAELYEFDTDNGKVVICSNLRETLKESLTAETNIMPKAFANKYINYMMNNPQITDSYILTTSLLNAGVKLPDDDRLMDENIADEITIKCFTEFSDDNKKLANAAQQAVIDSFISIDPEQMSTKLYRLGVFEFPPLVKSLSDEMRKSILANSDMINKRYADYKRDLSDSDINKTVISISELLSKYNPKSTIIGDGSPFAEFPVLFSAVSQNLKISKTAKNMFKDEIRKYLPEYGGTARIFTDKNIPERIKMAKLEQFLCHFAADKCTLFKFGAFNTDILENYIKTNNFELYKFLKEDVLSDSYIPVPSKLL